MTAPVVVLADVEKVHGGDHPLRVNALSIASDTQMSLFGLDAPGAEMFVHLVTGAVLPERGTITVGGRSTRDIATDTDWLASLDRFGLVSNRAVLIDVLPIAANLALPLTLAIDPMDAETRTRVEALAVEVGLQPARLPAQTASLTAGERLRVHLARALAAGPEVLLLEHPTAGLGEADERAAFGRTLRRIARHRRLAWVALTDDPTFADTAGGIRATLDVVSGRTETLTAWRRLWSKLLRV